LLTGNHAQLSLGSFVLDMNTFDLAENRFEVGEVQLEDTRANFRQTKIPAAGVQTEETADSTAALLLSLESIAMASVNVMYHQAVLGQTIQLDVGQFNLQAETIDLPNQAIEVKSLLLHESTVAY